MAETFMDAGESRVFETPRVVRAKVLLLAVLVGALCLFASLAIGLAAFAGGLWLGAHRSVAAAVALLVSLFIVRLGWKVILRSFRFRIAMGPDAIEMGRGRVSCSFAYNEVETITVPYGKDECGVWLRSAGKRACVLLSPSDEADCVKVLWRRCANAVFIDHSGREHLPRGGDRPSLTLHTLHKRCIVLAWASVICALSTVSVAILLGMELLGDFRQGGPNVDLEGVRAFAVNAVCAPSIGAFGLRKWQKARMIKAELSEFESLYGSGGADQ